MFCMFPGSWELQIRKGTCSDRLPNHQSPQILEIEKVKAVRRFKTVSTSTFVAGDLEWLPSDSCILLDIYHDTQGTELGP